MHTFDRPSAPLRSPPVDWTCSRPLPVATTATPSSCHRVRNNVFRPELPLEFVGRWVFTRCTRGPGIGLSAKAFGKKNFIRYSKFLCCNFLVFSFFFLGHCAAREYAAWNWISRRVKTEFPSPFTQRAERSPVRWRSRTSQSGEANFARPQARVRGLKLCETSRCPTGNPQVSKATRTKDHAVTAMLPSPTHAVQTSLSFWPWPGPSLRLLINT